jgi:hypothetical protein
VGQGSEISFFVCHDQARKCSSTIRLNKTGSLTADFLSGLSDPCCLPALFVAEDLFPVEGAVDEAVMQGCQELSISRD